MTPLSLSYPNSSTLQLFHLFFPNSLLNYIFYYKKSIIIIIIFIFIFIIFIYFHVGIFVKISVNNNDLNIDQIRERGGLCPLAVNPLPETLADCIAGVISPTTPLSSPSFLNENFLERCNSYSCCERINKGSYLRILLLLSSIIYFTLLMKISS